MEERIPCWCYHEAGHAVVSEECGRPVAEIRWARRNGGDWNPAIGYQTYADFAAKLPEPRALELMISVSYAGALAALKRDDGKASAECITDFRKIFCQMARLRQIADEHEAARAHAAGHARAWQIVEKCWPAIEQIAREVARDSPKTNEGKEQEKPIITGERIREIMRLHR